MRWSKFLVLSGLFLVVACRQKNVAEPAFYHWQTQLTIDSAQADLLSSLGAKRLYVKFFDVDWSVGTGQLMPQAQLQVDSANFSAIHELVPCIFITNRSFLEASGEELEAFPEKVFLKVEQLLAQLPADVAIRELQIDCDWTNRTRAAYFDFLTKVATHIRTQGWQLSVTIRLHQLANPRGTGLPPADRGMLMFYNMGSLSNWQENNSILNLEAALPYLSRTARNYPLPLDVALPVFNWGVLFRDGQFSRLLNNLDTAAMADTSRYEKLTPYRFRVRKSGYLQGRYVYKDDLIRVETVRPEQLAASHDLLQPFLERADYISFYHLDATVLKQLPDASLEAFFTD